MTDYDIPYECACCGKKSANYLCGKCMATKRDEDIAALRARLVLLEKVADCAVNIDERNRRPAHIDYCDWKNNDRSECCCGMNELRAALRSLKEGR